MQARLIGLKCESCGSKLMVGPDKPRLVCGHCGCEMLVIREGGTIELKSIIDAFDGVQASTQKVASELALKRYEKELEEVTSVLRQAEEGRSKEALAGLGFLVGAGVLAYIGIWHPTPGRDNDWIFVILGVAVCLMGSFAFLVGATSDHRTKEQVSIRRLSELKTLIKRNKEMADN